MPDSIAVDDQLAAACTDTAHRVGLTLLASLDVGYPVRWVEASPLEASAATRLALALCDHQVALCDHVAATPGRLVWSPRMPVLGCVDEFTAYTAAEPHTCDYCDTDVPTNHGRIMFGLGPVTVVATACDDCREQPTGSGIDPTTVREQALTIVVAELRARWSSV